MGGFAKCSLVLLELHSFSSSASPEASTFKNMKGIYVFHLSTLPLTLPCSIFGHEGERADDVAYVNWLNMVRAGLLGLEFYSPETNKWRQVCDCFTHPFWLMFLCMYVCVCMYVCLYVCMYVSVCMYVCMYVFLE